MAAVNETKLREALVSRGLCDLETAVAVGEVAQEVWAEATSDFATVDKIAIAIGDLRSSLLEALQESERIQVERHERLRQEVLDFRKEVAERDDQLRREIAEREERLRQDLAERDEQVRQELAKRDEQLRREIAGRDASYRDDQASRDRRTQWLIGLGFTAFGALASVLAVFT